MMSFCSILSIIMVTNKYFPKLQPKLQTCSRLIQEIHLGHLAGLDGGNLQIVGFDIGPAKSLGIREP